jgi:LacI family transcriptional regulator
MTAPVPPSPRPTVTHVDVARRAGVSTAVVSYVVNNGPRQVAPATAARVRAVIEELGYRPNLNARALRRGTTDLIGVVVPDSSNPFFAELAQGIEQAAAQRGYAMVLVNSNNSGEQERLKVESLANRRVSGLLVASALPRHQLDLGDRRGIPTAIINTDGPVPGFHTIGPDFRQGAQTAVEHVLNVHMARTVALATGPPIKYVEPNSREQGYLDALTHHARPQGPIVKGGFSREGGYRMGLELIARELPDAVFAISDLQAIGILRALHEADVRVPEDIAIVTFDGTNESEYSWPALTVVRQPITAMARAAVDAVLHPSQATPEHSTFNTDLVIRRSCGCTTTYPAPEESETTTG